MTKRLLCFFAAAALAPSSATAECATAGTGARCLSVDSVATRTSFGPGERLPQNQYFVLLNTEYYGLPAAGPGWRYYEVEGRILRVANRTREVLEDVTQTANDAW